jgi:transcriptional regulator GlxA family with amidase domain
MSETSERTNRAMLRVRDHIDRSYDEPLDVADLARLVPVSPDHLIRTFRAVFGETPHRYLQRRRVERAMFLLRSSEHDVTTVCMAVGFSSLGSFSRTFTAIVGETPTDWASRGPLPAAAGCFTMAWTRPSSFVPPPAARPSISEKHAEGVGD